MCRENELSQSLFPSHDWHYAFYNETIVKIIFGLINYERGVGFQEQ